MTLARIFVQSISDKEKKVYYTGLRYFFAWSFKLFLIQFSNYFMTNAKMLLSMEIIQSYVLKNYVKTTQTSKLDSFFTTRLFFELKRCSFLKFRPGCKVMRIFWLPVIS
jgi:hypothetical protein